MAHKLAEVDDRALVANLVIVQSAMVLIAVLGSWWLDYDLLSLIRFDYQTLAEIAATSIALIGMALGSRRAFPKIWRGLDRTTIELLGNSKLKFATWAIISISILAGIGEEFLFRGFIQGWLEEQLPIALAILIPTALFALAHPHSKAYMAAVFVIGSIVGISFAITNSLLVAIASHIIFDIVALWRVRQMIEAARSEGRYGLAPV